MSHNWNLPDGCHPNDKNAPWNQDDDPIECDDCGGTGVNGHDCGEDTCCCLNPEENVECQRCGGAGHYWSDDDEDDDYQDDDFDF